MANIKNKSDYCTFYLVRHGETEWNVKGLIHGYADAPLTKTGVRQAKILKRKFKNINFASVFSSDLKRAKKTAQIISHDNKLVIKTTQALREGNHGKYEGKKSSLFKKELKQILDKQAQLLEKDKPKFKLADDIESCDEIAIRAIEFLKEISTSFINQNILVVAHGGVLAGILISLGFGNYSQIWGVEVVDNTAWIKLQCDGINFFIEKTHGINIAKKRY